MIETAHRLGVRQNLQAYPSMPLGAFEVTLLELTAAYSVFANQGLAFSPYLIERITDANGDVLEQTHPDAREVETPQTAFQLLQILKGVTQRGTAASAARLKLNIAGKTGTTNDFTDAWFIGMHAPLHDRRLGRQRPEDPDDRQGRRRRQGRAADLDPPHREDEGRRPDRSAGRLRSARRTSSSRRSTTTPGSRPRPTRPIPVLEAFVSGTQPTEEWNPRAQEIAKLPWSLQQPFYLPKKGELAESAALSPVSAPPPHASPAEGATEAAQEAGASVAWTSTFSVATTSRWSRTWTVWVPRRRMGSASSTRRRSTSMPLAASASAISEAVTEP